MSNAAVWHADVEFNTVVDKLGKAISRKCLRKAIRPATNPSLNAARTIAGEHVRTGALKKSLSLKVSIKGGKGAGIVGPRSNYLVVNGKAVNSKKHVKQEGETRIRPSYYAHFLTGGSRRQRAFGFMRTVTDIGGPKFGVILRQELGDAITEELKKIVRP